MIRYSGGKREGNNFYVKRGDKWIDILEAAKIQDERRMEDENR